MVRLLLYAIDAGAVPFADRYVSNGRRERLS
jgi:hypothetical protein